MSPADWRFWSALFAAMIFLSYPAAADCDNARNPEAAIIDCTQSITSGKWGGRYLSAFYSRRADAYRKKGDNDNRAEAESGVHCPRYRSIPSKRQFPQASLSPGPPSPLIRREATPAVA